MKKSYVMSLIVLIFLFFSFSFLLLLNSKDKSNYVLNYKEMELLIKYCKTKNVSLFERDFIIISKEPLVVRKEKVTYYIVC